MTRTGPTTRMARFLVTFFLLIAVWGAPVSAAPYAAMVIDARDGKVLHSRNADTRLHPASLTKMMTLYVAFEAVQNGELTMDSQIRISRKAAAEQPSKLGLRAGQTIALRYLVRAAAVKSANDAATAIAEGISGSEAAFARRMNRTAKALGMSRTTFKNAHGLTESGHLSTARDMTTMGRALFYHYPQYYNLFSRRSTDAGLRAVNNTNRRFLANYSGADGIKTGYTRAAGFNLVSSAERNGERIIATVFGGNSTASRNARVAELLDMGFKRAKRRVAVAAPGRPAYRGQDGAMPGRSTRVVRAVARSLRPVARPLVAPPEEVIVAMEQGIEALVSEVAQEGAAVPDVVVVEVRDAVQAPVAPAPRPEVSLAEVAVPDASPADAPPEGDPLVAQADPSLPGPIPGPEAQTDTDTLLAALPDAAPDLPTDVAATPGIAVLSLQSAPAALRQRPAGRPAMGAAAVPAPVVVAQVASAETPRPHARPPLGRMAFGPEDLNAAPPAETRVVTRISTSGGRLWRVSLGAYPTRFAAEQALLETALRDMTVLDGALRKVVQGQRGFEARFLGLTETQANRTCSRMSARGSPCEIARAG